MLKKISLIAFLLVTSLLSSERDSFGININKDDVEVEGREEIGRLLDSQLYSNIFIDGNFLNSAENLYGIGLSVENSLLTNYNLILNVGLRGVFSSHNDKDFSAAPIMLGLKTKLFSGDVPTTYLGAKATYAPSALTFQDADEYKEYRVEVDSDIIPNINIYAGYRNIDTDYKNKTYNLNDSFYAGFKFVLDPR
jgi:hypothetical protein